MCNGNHFLHSFLSSPKLAFCDVITKLVNKSKWPFRGLFETSWQVFVYFSVPKGAKILNIVLKNEQPHSKISLEQ